MNKLVISAKKAEEAGYGQLILTCGMSFPPYTDTLAFADMAISAGVDILACPVMISDVHKPWMMGGTEQILDSRNVVNEIGPGVCWGSIDALRAKYPDYPIMGGSFPSDLMAYGVDRFADDCAEHGLCGIDCPGYSYVLNDSFSGAARGHKALEEKGICMIQQISTDMAMAPEGTREFELLLSVLRAGRGFNLLMADAGGKSGATGALNVEKMKPAVVRVRQIMKELNNELPLITVCGVSTPQNGIEAVREIGSDGVMISSAIIRRMLAGETMEQIGEYVRSMKESLKR